MKRNGFYWLLCFLSFLEQVQSLRLTTGTVLIRALRPGYHLLRHSFC